VSRLLFLNSTSAQSGYRMSFTLDLLKNTGK